jgi:hypothetical membrane protein
MIGLWTLASILRPAYDQLTQTGSELGTGEYSIVMNVNFVATGVLILIFWVGLVRTWHPGKWSWLGLVMLAVSAATEVATGIFPCDPGCPLNDGSVSQMIHTGIAIVFFGAMGSLPSVHRNRSEPGSILDILSFIFPSNRSGEYWALPCIFRCCPSLISLHRTVATFLSRCTVSMDRDNGQSAVLLHKKAKKVGCEITTSTNCSDNQSTSRMRQGRANYTVL